MTFMIIVIALLVERFFHWAHLRQWQWFTHYQRWLEKQTAGWMVWLLFIVAVLLPVLIVGCINFLLSGWWYGILKLFFGIIVLMYCLGPDNLWVQVYGCLDQLNQDDLEKATKRVNAVFATGMPDNSQAFHQQFTRAIFLAAYRSVFAVLFWFVLAGPAGALFYSLIALLASDSSSRLMSMAVKLQQLLDWIPVRLFTFIFALAGHFSDVFSQWKHFVLKGPDSNKLLLTECGIAALDTLEGKNIPENGSAEKKAVVLLDRVFIMGLVMLAVIVLI